VPPNAFESKKEFANFAQKVNINAHSDKARITFMSDTGALDVKTDELTGLAEVALEGAGDALLKSGRKTIFSSK